MSDVLQRLRVLMTALHRIPRLNPAWIVLLFAVACSIPLNPVQPTPEPTLEPDTILPAGTCHYQGGGSMPDPVCTPGAWNPNVTQATTGSTICVSGWTATVRPPVSYTDRLKLAQLATYGQPLVPSDYELDHFYPIEGGGDPVDPKNLWPQLRRIAQGASAKDQAENKLHSDICSGRKLLADAQTQWAAGWQNYR